MDELTTFIERAQTGDCLAFDEVVRRFQDMAVGYALGLLRDRQDAEDAAQDAFLEAWRRLPELRAPGAFGVWFRRIVYKHCDRRFRRTDLATVPLEGAGACHDNAITGGGSGREAGPRSAA